MSDFDRLPDPFLRDVFGGIERRLSALERPRGTRYAEALDEVSTAAAVPTLLGGPEITVSVPSGGAFVSFLFEAEFRNTLSGAFAVADITTPTVLDIANSDATPTYTRVSSSPFQASGSVWPRGGWTAFFAEPGELTLTMRYRASGGGTAYFRNRRLWVAVG